MRDLILKVILHHWDRYIFPGTTMKSFFVDIYKFLILLDVVCLDDSHSIAIHARRSRQWIALYLACFIKGVDFIVLSPYLERNKLLSVLNFTSMSYLFTESKFSEFNRNDMTSTPFLRGAYDIDTIKPISLRRSVYNYNIPHLSLDTVTDAFIDPTKVLAVQDRYRSSNQESNVMNMTSGVSYFDNKIVVSSARSIKATVQKGRNLLPYHELHGVYSEVEFAHSHIITVLIPFIKGCAFVESADDANVIIESTETFEQKWYEEVESILEVKFLYWLFKKRIFQNLFDIIAGRTIRRFYDNMEHIVVYNGAIQERALKIARKYLPLHVTYGSQEANQLMACNDFSAPAYCRPGSVGRSVGLLTLNKHNELEFESEGVFDLYLGDAAHTAYIKSNYPQMLPTDMYKVSRIRTGDHGAIVEGSIILKGRMSSVYKHDDKITNLDEVERYIRSLPYIEECIMIPWENDGVHVIVQIRKHLIEAHKLGWFETTRLLDRFYKTLSNAMENHIVLADAVISPETFYKSFDGKIRTRLYRPD